jgi:hypothetical protein
MDQKNILKKSDLRDIGKGHYESNWIKLKAILKKTFFMFYEQYKNWFLELSWFL